MWRKGSDEVDLKAAGVSLDTSGGGDLVIQSFVAANAGAYQCITHVDIGTRELTLTSSIASVTNAGTVSLFLYHLNCSDLNIFRNSFFILDWAIVHNLKLKLKT